MKSGKNRASFLKTLHVLGFIVRGAFFPAAEQNANPLEGQSANDRVILFALLGIVINIVTGPLAFGGRESGKLMKSLTEEFRVCLAAIDHAHFSAASGHGRDT